MLQRNITHFGQAQGTPNTTEPVEDILGYEGTNDSAKDILLGHIPEELSSISPCMTKILEKLGDGDGLGKINAEVTLSEFRSVISKWNEKTATSPSGRHLGHFNVLTNNKPVINHDNK